MTGWRSLSGAINKFEAVVRIAHDSTVAPSGDFQLSQISGKDHGRTVLEADVLRNLSRALPPPLEKP